MCLKSGYFAVKRIFVVVMINYCISVLYYTESLFGYSYDYCKVQSAPFVVVWYTYVF